MKTRIHVNQHNIFSNQKHINRGCEVLADAPVLTVKDYKQNRKGDCAEIVKDGCVVARVIYSPESPLPCGARVWIETEETVIVR